MIRRVSPKFAIAALPVAISLLVFAGCGGSDSKPAYCANVDAFQQSVDDFGTSLKSLNPTEISNAGDQVENTGQAMISSARADFPAETTALRTSIKQVRQGLDQLSTSSDKPVAIAALVADLSELKTDYANFREASNSACE